MRKKLLAVLAVLLFSYNGWSQCNAISSFPYVEDFDGSNFTPFFTLDPCWSATPVPNAQSWAWHLYTGNSAISSRTCGVSSDFSGSGNFLFAYSDPAATVGQTCEIVSPNFDLSTLTNPALEFAYHMYGTSIGKLRIDVKSATGSWTPVDSIVGQQQAASTDPWLFYTVNLSAYSSTGTQFRFVGFRGGQGGSDINIDEVKVYQDTTCGAPANLQLVGTPLTTATFTWSQKSLDSCEIIYDVTGFSPSTGGLSQIAYGDTVSISGLTQFTTYDAYVRHFCNGDTSALVGPLTFTTQCDVVTAPYSTDFTVSEYGRANQSLSGGYGWNNCWTQASLTNQTFWVLDTAGGQYTQSATTGPDFDNTNYPNMGGAFMVLKSSSSVVDDIAYSPMIDISNLQDPALTFAYHMYGADVATLRVDVWDGSSWTNGVWGLSGEQQDSADAPWGMAYISLANFSSVDTIQVRFHASGSTSGPNSDIAVDDVSIDEKALCTPTANAVVTPLGSSVYQFDASGSVGIGTVDWLFGDGNSGTGTVVNHTYASFGTYNVSCIVTNGCGVDTVTNSLQVISVDEFNSISQLIVYPNPASESVFIDLDSRLSQSALIELISMEGRTLLQSIESLNQGENTVQLDLEGLPVGVYDLRIQMNNDVLNARLIIE